MSASAFETDQMLQDVFTFNFTTCYDSPRSAIRRSKSTSDSSCTPQIHQYPPSTSSALRVSESALPNTSDSRRHLSYGSNNSRYDNTLSSDRFIPNRSTTDLEYSKHSIAHPELSPGAQSEVVKTRILSFKSKAPNPPESHSNSLKVLYSSGKGKAIKANNVRVLGGKPMKILDAPGLVDDFYLHLVDWSSLNQMVVILDNSVFIWDAGSGQIQELSHHEDNLTSVSWVKEGDYLAVSNHHGTIQLWDVSQNKLLRSMEGHLDRVAVMDWNSHILASGSRSGQIHLHDVRIQQHRTHVLYGHSQEVCGLQWSPTVKMLASGGNDNLVQIWDERSLSNPQYTLNHHQSAIKAVSWCTWAPQILSTGGGTADRNINFWNMANGHLIKSIDSGSQVSSIIWNSEYKELVSSHGFFQNQLTVWKYPNLTKVGDLVGHSSRVLSCVLSPDQSTVASVGGDQTIRIWNIWPLLDKKRQNEKKYSSSSLFQNIR